MKRNVSSLFRRVFGLACIICMATVAQTQTWQLVWRDDFDGTALDNNKWTQMIGDGTVYGLPAGWGNNELQYYASANATVADGFLTITAKTEQMGGRAYTSSRIRSLGKGDWKYGRFEMRAKLPTGQGLWPAFWMMPSDNVYGSWAASGEIDIMEIIGSQPGTVHGTIHYGGAWPAHVRSGTSYTLLNNASFADAFHTFALEWTEGTIRWFVDGVLYATQTNWYTSGHPFPAPFDQRFHCILNVAVGGTWPGAPDASTSFPQSMVVDYVAVYQDSAQIATSVGRNDPLTSPVRLDQNYPNPFNPSTEIRYHVPHTGFVRMSVFDLLGREVALLVDGQRPAGSHLATWDAGRIMSGAYFYRVEVQSVAGEKWVETRNMILLR